MAKAITPPTTPAPAAKRGPKPFDAGIVAAKAEKLAARILREGKRRAKADATDATLPILRSSYLSIVESATSLRKLAPRADVSGPGF